MYIPSNQQDISTLLADAAREIPGWTPHDQLFTLFILGLSTAPLGGEIFELGSWCGRSSVALGLAARASGSHLHCVDLFPAREDWRENADGTYSMRVKLPNGEAEAYQTQTVWKEPFERDIAPLYREYPTTLEVFRSVIARYELSAFVTDYRGTSSLLNEAIPPNTQFRLAFVDGDHGYAAVCRDIERVTPRLLPGGWICFDDAFTCYEGVDSAIRDRVLDSTEFDLHQQLTRKLFAARKRLA